MHAVLVLNYFLSPAFPRGPATPEVAGSIQAERPSCGVAAALLLQQQLQQHLLQQMLQQQLQQLQQLLLLFPRGLELPSSLMPPQRARTEAIAAMPVQGESHKYPPVAFCSLSAAQQKGVSRQLLPREQQQMS